jgi:hypothetical protein
LVRFLFFRMFSISFWFGCGGFPASSLQDSAKEKDFYVCMVASAPQVQSVLFGDDLEPLYGGGEYVEAVDCVALFHEVCGHAEAHGA